MKLGKPHLQLIRGEWNYITVVTGRRSVWKANSIRDIEERVKDLRVWLNSHLPYSYRNGEKR